MRQGNSSRRNSQLRGKLFPAFCQAFDKTGRWQLFLTGRFATAIVKVLACIFAVVRLSCQKNSGNEDVAPPRNISDDDSTLFRTAAGVVKPVTDDRIGPDRRSRLARPKHTTAIDDPLANQGLVEVLELADSELGETLFFTRPGLQKKLLRKLRAGQIPNQAEVDLHGMNLSEARAVFARFLQECRDNHWRCVRIVHGKGLGSKTAQPIIKSHVNRWLRLRDEVLAFSSAKPVHGGTGAVYVLLRN